MAAPHEAATFKYSKGIHGCFVVPKKKDQLIYGYLHHNIGFSHEEDCGAFVMEDGTMETYSLRIIDAATLRLLKGNKHFCPCHKGFEAAKERLRQVDFNRDKPILTIGNRLGTRYKQSLSGSIA